MPRAGARFRFFRLFARTFRAGRGWWRWPGAWRLSTTFTTPERCLASLSVGSFSCCKFCLFVCNHHFLLFGLTRGRFYPQRSSSGQAVVTSVVPSPPRYVPSLISCIGFQRSQPLVDCHRMLLAYALSLFAINSDFLCKKKSLRACTR